MAIQIVAIIKAVGPYIAQIAAATIPAFTSKPETIKTDPVLTKQIEELQSAATQNAQSIHVLAENMQQAIQGIEIAAQEVKKKVNTYKTMLILSLGLSLASLVTCVYLLTK
jgi:hypothetical protein